jgi:hypothetical protein
MGPHSAAFFSLIPIPLQVQSRFPIRHLCPNPPP